MATVQQWGRKESIIWPPRGYIYTLGAFIFACILTGLFIYIRFQFGLPPLQRYYLPYYLRTETAGVTHPVSQYQLLYVSDGEKPGRAVLNSDVQPGSTDQFGGRPLPLMLTPETAQHGTYYLIRESLRNYQNKTLHAWIARWIYQDVPIYKLFTMQLVFGLAAFALQLPFSIRKDIRRIKDLRYGRRLKGPVLVPHRYSENRKREAAFDVPAHGIHAADGIDLRQEQFLRKVDVCRRYDSFCRDLRSATRVDTSCVFRMLISVSLLAGRHEFR